ncbi:MarR family winged helix-turn-helix transcriptional regulator [Streptomyces specialis]|uniref:MarR family winged helix-turn-helix transcriptional regulator n=1 Tax=Streptomyces specialis TaxID=498367 RepID=UPI00099E9FE0|nr:MarR family transcriptional regulator [Streptomyces specialis]
MNEFLPLFIRAGKLMRGAADDAMRRHGVRVGQNLVLETLWETDGLTPGEIAERLRVATPTVVKSAARMEASGLLVKRRDPADARLVRLYLTERGRAVQGPVEDARHRLELRATATLTAEERHHLRRALTKIITEMERTAGPVGVDMGDTDTGAAAPHPPDPHTAGERASEQA